MFVCEGVCGGDVGGIGGSCNKQLSEGEGMRGGGDEGDNNYSKEIALQI